MIGVEPLCGGGRPSPSSASGAALGAVAAMTLHPAVPSRPAGSAGTALEPATAMFPRGTGEERTDRLAWRR